MRAVDDELGTIHVFTGTRSNGKQIRELMKDYRLLEQEIVDLKQEIERVKNACTEWLNKYDESENEKQTLEEENERLNNIINNIDKKCKYLLENEKVIINEKTYYKQKCDDIITNFIYEELKGSDKE